MECSTNGNNKEDKITLEVESCANDKVTTNSNEKDNNKYNKFLLH